MNLSPIKRQLFFSGNTFYDGCKSICSVHVTVFVNISLNTVFRLRQKFWRFNFDLLILSIVES